MFERTIKCFRDYPQVLKCLHIEMVFFASEWGCGNSHRVENSSSKEEGHWTVNSVKD